MKSVYYEFIDFMFEKLINNRWSRVKIVFFKKGEKKLYILGEITELYFFRFHFLYFFFSTINFFPLIKVII